MDNKKTYHFHFTLLLIYIIDRRVKDYIYSTYTLTTGKELSSLLKPHEYPVEIKSGNPIIKVQTMNGRIYDPTLGMFLSPDNNIQAPDMTHNFNRYAYCLNNPLIYTDPSGEFVWFVVGGAIVGAYIGASTTAESGFSLNPGNWGQDWWQGAIVGGLLGATAGSFVASAVGASGITVGNMGAVATKGWGITSTALQSASLNIGMSAIQGQGLEGMWKAGITGLASGAWTATGGLGLVKEGFLGKLAYQNVGLAGRSIGRNWAAGEDLFSKVSVGLGPVNLTLGEDQSLLQWQNNIGNIAFNTIGLANLATGGKMNFDWKNLTPVYSGGALDKISQGAIGAYGIMGDQMSVRKFHSHELHHVWQSRSLGDMFLPLYAMQGLSALIMGQSPIGKANYFETQAYGYYWWR